MSINTSGGTILAMSAREELLKENEEQIHRSESRISSMMVSLGRKGLEDDTAMFLPGGRKLIQECRRWAGELERAESRLVSIRDASREHEGRKAKLSEKIRESKGIDEEIGQNLSSLGAMVYEKCGFSLLDKEAFSIVYRDREREERRGFPRAFLISREARFRRYGRLVIDNGLDSALDGRSAETASRIRALISMKEEAFEEKDRLSSMIEAKKHSYAAFSKDGVERAEKSIGEARRKEEEALQSYGSFLWDKGSLWIDGSTPSLMLDDIERILEEKKVLDSLVLERARLRREAKADDIMALIGNEDKKLSILRKEKERIEKEICSVEEERRKLLLKLEEIRTGQGS